MIIGIVCFKNKGFLSSSKKKFNILVGLIVVPKTFEVIQKPVIFALHHLILLLRVDEVFDFGVELIGVRFVNVVSTVVEKNDSETNTTLKR